MYLITSLTNWYSGIQKIEDNHQIIELNRNQLITSIYKAIIKKIDYKTCEIGNQNPQRYEIYFCPTASWAEVEKLLNQDGLIENEEIRAWINFWRSEISLLRGLKKTIDQYKKELALRIRDQNLTRNIETKQTEIKEKLNLLRSNLLQQPVPLSVKRNVLCKEIVTYLRENWNKLIVFALDLDISMDESVMAVNTFSNPGDSAKNYESLARAKFVLTQVKTAVQESVSRAKKFKLEDENNSVDYVNVLREIVTTALKKTNGCLKNDQGEDFYPVIFDASTEQMTLSSLCVDIFNIMFSSKS